ncbi:hypothetical protein [Alteromonas lipotrueae]|uniref:hypothetical protein n=1 Tax=Alteromonas lipotrueae TaxID=2803814 RepID=UPI001C4436FD|nr:hypothetical protein [Alteromonas lipotrueae]
MGLFSSSSKSSNTTNNYDNRVINDYANANWDNSIDVHEESLIEGDFNNNTGTITMVDPNVMDAYDGMIAGMGAATRDSHATANSAMGYVKGVATDSMEFASGLFNNGVSAMQGVTGDALELADGVNARTLDSAMMVHDSALTQVQMGNELAVALSGNARAQQADTNAALNDGFEQMMQFTEQFSRSDGAALAETNMKTVALVAVAGVMAAYMFRKKG